MVSGIPRNEIVGSLCLRGLLPPYIPMIRIIISLGVFLGPPFVEAPISSGKSCGIGVGFILSVWVTGGRMAHLQRHVVRYLQSTPKSGIGAWEDLC